MSVKKENKDVKLGRDVKRVILAIFLILCLLVLARVFRNVKPSFNLNGWNNLAKKDTITISGVQVKDFTKGIENANEKSYITLSKNDDYHIFYIPSQTLFYISVLNSPFDKYKLEAEKKFLEDLEINQNEACKLNVDMTTPNAVNPDHAGQIYHLSYCNK